MKVSTAGSTAKTGKARVTILAARIKTRESIGGEIGEGELVPFTPHRKQP
jgi:hypothetical protein